MTWRYAPSSYAVRENSISRVVEATAQRRRHKIVATLSGDMYRYETYLWRGKKYTSVPFKFAWFTVSSDGSLSDPRGDIAFDHIVEAQDALDVLRSKMSKRGR